MKKIAAWMLVFFMVMGVIPWQEIVPVFAETFDGTVTVDIAESQEEDSQYGLYVDTIVLDELNETETVDFSDIDLGSLISSDDESNTVESENSVLELEESYRISGSKNNVNTAAVNDAPSDGSRYTVLLLDISGSMSGTPLQKMKEAAIKFCKAQLETKEKSYIAVVKYESYAYVACDFTDNLSTLTSRINGLSVTGGTNTSSALLMGKEIMASVPSTAVKNMVLLSDGLPQSGKQSYSGPYSSSDQSVCYSYANAAYAIANEIMTECNLYSLGFFHSLSGNNLTFGKRFMEDIQNKGYYNVTDVNDLEFAFGEISDQIIGEKLEDLFVSDHLDFLKSDEYQDYIVKGFTSNLTQILKDAVSNSDVNSYNTLKALNNCLDLEDPFETEVELYEFIFAQLLLNDETVSGLKTQYEEFFLSNLKEYIYTFLDYLDAGDDFSDSVETINKLKNYAKKLDTLDPWSADFQTTYENFMKYTKSLEKNEDDFLEWYVGYVDKNITLRSVAGSFIVDVGFDVILGVCETVQDVIEFCSYGQAYMDASESFKTFLRYLVESLFYENTVWSGEYSILGDWKQFISYENCCDGLIDFIDKMERYSKDGAFKFALSIINENAGGLDYTIVKDIAVDFTDSILLCIPYVNLIPILKSCLSVSQMIVELTTDIDDQGYDADMLKRLYIINLNIWSVVDTYRHNLESEPTMANASLFDYAVNMYRAASIMAESYGEDYEAFAIKKETDKLITNSQKGLLYTVFHAVAYNEKEEYQNLLCHRESIQYNHKTKILKYDDTKLKIFTIACPVAVSVTDDKGNLLAYLYDEQSTIREGYEQYFHVIPENDSTDYLKTVIVPENYTVSLNVKETGKMDVFIGKVENNKIIDSQSFVDVSIVKGQNGSFAVNEEDGDRLDLVIGNKKLVSDVASAYSVEVDRDLYSVAEGQRLTIVARMATTEKYVEGSHKYIGYLAYQSGLTWVQIASWYIDGGICQTTIGLTLNKWEPKGKNRFTVSIFPADNFATGASLYDRLFWVNVLEPTFDLTLNADGGTCDINNLQIIHGLEYGELPVPEKKGYVFGGWYTKKDGAGKAIRSDTIVKAEANETIYAFWMPESYEVKLNANGGSCNVSGIRVKYGRTYNLLADLELEGPDQTIFDGWYTAASGGSRVNSKTVVSKTSDHTLYAHWKKKSYSLSECSVSLSYTSRIFRGSACKPAVTIKDPDGNVLEKDKHFTVSYKDNINVGTARAVITAVSGSGYSGSVTKTYKIAAKSIESLSVSLSSSSCTYSGKYRTKTVVFSDAPTEMIKGTDYTVSYLNNKNPGIASVTIVGCNNYKGSVTLNFSIKPTQPVIKSVYSTSSGCKISWEEVYGVTGYYIYRDGVKIKTVSKDTLSYVDTAASVNGSDYSYKIYAYVSVAGVVVKSSVSDSVQRRYLSTPSITRLSNVSTRKMVVTWLRNSKASGYQIQYSKSSSFTTKTTVTVSGNSVLSATIGSLTMNAKYYIRMRSYKTLSDKKHYSAWSSKKYVTIVR